MHKIENQNILITGGSKGIGRAIAWELASRGANVFLVARDPRTLSEAKAAIGDEFPRVKVGTASCDVSDFEAVCGVVEAMLRDFGAVHGLINNAGFAAPKYFEEIEADEFRRVMEVDYLGSVFATKAVLPHLKSGGFIAFTSSVAGYVGTFGYTSYAPAKFAQIGFAESLAQELLSKNIQVSVLCPPDTDTPGFAIENKTKPYETRAISKGAKLMTAEAVAKKFVGRLLRGEFLINVNLESRVIYRFKGIAPGLFRKVMHGVVRRIQTKGDTASDPD